MREKFTAEPRTVHVKDLKPHYWLEQYRLTKPDKFESLELERFGLHDKQCIVCSEGFQVLYNWHAVQAAVECKATELQVTIILGLTDMLVPQVVSIANLRMRISHRAVADLIVDLSGYLTTVQEGIEYAVDVPGNDIRSKIAYLLGYKSGTSVQYYQRIYKVDPALLDEMEEGRLGLVEANEKCSRRVQAQGTGDDTDGDDDGEGDDGDPDDARGDGDPSTGAGTGGGNGPEDTGGNGANKNDGSPRQPLKRMGLAGEQRMVHCEPVSGITVRYFDGSELVIDATEGTAKATFDGVETTPLYYQARKEDHPQGGRFHLFTDVDSKGHFEWIERNIAGLMPDVPDSDPDQNVNDENVES